MSHLPGSAPRLDVRDYSDYRVYLRAIYESRKAANRNYSFRYLSQKAGINSSSFFKKVIEGKRNLTSQTLHKTCKALGLKEGEAEYFEDLVSFNQAKTMREKNLHFEKLIEQQKRRSFQRISEDRYDYFSEWYHCVVRELAVLSGLGEDPARLASHVRPPITPKQASQSLRLLEKLGFLRRENDALVQAEPLLSTGFSIKSHFVKRFQLEMLKRTMGAYEGLSDRPRLMSCNVVALSSANYERCVELLRGLRSQIMSHAVGQEKADRVYALNLNFFPCSAKVEDDAT